MLAPIFTQCATEKIRMHNPATPTEVRKQSVVGFGLYRKYTDGLIPIEHALVFTRQHISISEVVSIDEKNKTVVTKPATDIMQVTTEQEGDKTVRYGMAPNLDPFFTFLIPYIRKKYCVTRVTWEGIGCGGKCRVRVWRTPNPYQSFKALPLAGTPGKIVFKGLYRMDELNTTEDDPEKYKFYEMVLLKKKWKKNMMVKTEESDYKKQYIRSNYNRYESDTDAASVPRNFFIQISERQESGYWKDQADQALSQLK